MRNKENAVKKTERLPGIALASIRFDMGAQRARERARYQRHAREAAAFERAGQYAAAAEAWGEAYKSARGPNADWCQCRLTLCLNYASAQQLPQGLSPNNQTLR